MATEILHTFDNAEDGVRAHVARVERGFSVSLEDTDAGEFVGTAIIYPDEYRAIDEARTVAFGCLAGKE